MTTAKKFPDDAPLLSVGAHVVDVAEGVLVKRGVVEFVIAGRHARRALDVVLAATSGKGCTTEDIVRLFSKAERPAASTLVSELIARRILNPVASAAKVEQVENSLDIFYWHFGLSAKDLAGDLGAKRIIIIGVNTISRRLAVSLRASYMTAVEVVDFVPLRNLRIFGCSDVVDVTAWEPGVTSPTSYDRWTEQVEPKSIACIVATSDFGTAESVREWNAFCVEEDRPFCPVVLQDMVGQIGPIVIPHETACYECFRRRKYANLDDADTEDAAERNRLKGQLTVAAHPTLTSILADIAAIELLKFFTAIPAPHIGSMIEVDLLQPSITTHPVLKLPRCSVCGSMNQCASVTPEIDEFMHS